MLPAGRHPCMHPDSRQVARDSSSAAVVYAQQTANGDGDPPGGNDVKKMPGLAAIEMVCVTLVGSRQEASCSTLLLLPGEDADRLSAGVELTRRERENPGLSSGDAVHARGALSGDEDAADKLDALRKD